MLPGSSTRCRAVSILVGMAVVSFIIPAIAAARVTVPPGATEGDQYFEEVPNGGGSGSPNLGGTAGGGGQAAATQDLNALGADGKAAAGLANANLPPKAESGQGNQPSSSTEGEGGMGLWFPLLLVVTALAAIAYGLRRLSPA